MASHQDVQDLLRLLTTGRNKLGMLPAMGRVKALQTAKLNSIATIADSNLEAITKAISDEKAAKSLLAACKAHVKSLAAGTKRPATDSLGSSSKKGKSAYEIASEPQTPAELEASLILPQPSIDEEAIERCTIYTNRAPLVLAFAVQLLKYTMPEQPLSSRLSLAQAVVSLNSRSKAVSIGLEKKGADEEGWGTGQPKVKVLGRDVAVLKRGGYVWKEEEVKQEGGVKVEEDDGTSTAQSSATMPSQTPTQPTWTVSQPVTLKSSTFIARSIVVTSSSEASSTLSNLLDSNPDLKGASHNITAYRVQSSPARAVLERSNDDGESGGGRHLLGVLKEEGLVNVLLVVTRWYGGIMLGMDRWRIMSQVSRDALSQRLRVTGTVAGEALWGLDLEAMKSGSTTGRVGMPIHRPEGARAYLLKSFHSPAASASASVPTTEEGEDEKKVKKERKKTASELAQEREDNLGMLLGALDLLFSSWAPYISKEELDRRAWGWYVGVRPDVADGVAGWGGKGEVKLKDILGKRRKG